MGATICFRRSARGPRNGSAFPTRKSKSPTARGRRAASARLLPFSPACRVAVGPRTGHVDVLDYVAIEDVGVAINPHIVHGQAIGALVQGLGSVFLDQILYDRDAQMLNASLMDYLVPLSTDFSKVR